MLVAQVVLKDGAGADPSQSRRELMGFMRQRLPSYKVPRRIEIVEALPKTAVGKVLRREIRETVGTQVDDDH